MNNLNLVLAGFIILMCLVFSYFLIFTDLMVEGDFRLIGNRRTILVIILIGYAIFRSFRLYKSMSQKK